MLSNGFEILVQQSWEGFLSSANPIKKLSYKLKAIKGAIKSWLLTHRNEYITRLKAIEADILTESNPLSMDDWQYKQSLRQEHFNILLDQEIY